MQFFLCEKYTQTRTAKKKTIINNSINKLTITIITVKDLAQMSQHQRRYILF